MCQKSLFCRLRWLSGPPVWLYLRKHREKKRHQCCPFAKVTHFSGCEQLDLAPPFSLFGPDHFFPDPNCEQMRMRMHIRSIHAQALPPGILPTEHLCALAADGDGIVHRCKTSVEHVPFLNRSFAAFFDGCLVVVTNGNTAGVPRTSRCITFED